MMSLIWEGLQQNRTFPRRLFQAIILVLLALIYGVLFYKIWTNQLALDFYAFHTSSAALFQGDNPYSNLKIPYFSTQYNIGANLNMPIFIMLCWPLSKLHHQPAVMLWSGLSFVLGLLSASIAFKLAFSAEFIKQNRMLLYSLYLLLFSTIANTEIVQIGSYIAFFLILGYDAYIKGRYVLAAVLWGIIISIKLFPGLLFFYVLRQRQYKVVAIMAVTVVILSTIPLLTYGMAIYTSYSKLLPQVPWYGDSWNASLYGFLFRLFVDASTLNNLNSIQMLYSGLAFGGMAWYLKKIYSIPTQTDTYHQQFCLTLVVMLLISPLGWMYYFPLLLFPVLMTGIQAWGLREKKQLVLWYISVCFLNFPSWNVHVDLIPTWMEKLSIGSVWFYGLILLVYVLNKGIAQAKASYEGGKPSTAQARRRIRYESLPSR